MMHFKENQATSDKTLESEEPKWGCAHLLIFHIPIFFVKSDCLRALANEILIRRNHRSAKVYNIAANTHMLCRKRKPNSQKLGFVICFDSIENASMIDWPNNCRTGIDQDFKQTFVFSELFNLRVLVFLSRWIMDNHKSGVEHPMSCYAMGRSGSDLRDSIV